MPVRETIVVNGKTFATKKAAKKHFREMLARYADKEPILGEDDADLRSVLTRHPEVLEKVGVGIEGFFADRAVWGTRCFYLRRSDGTTTDFSFISCVDGRAPTPHQDFLEAARTAVQPQIRDAKRRYFEANRDANGTVPCDLTERPLRFEEAHVDHAEPMTFEVIVQTFLAAKQIDTPKDHLTRGQDMQHLAAFRDPKLAEEFREFHKRVARLRWLAKAANLAIGPKHQLRHRRATIVLE